MKMLAWLLVAAAVAGLAYAIWVWRRRWDEHRRVSEERLAAFIAQARPAPAPAAAAATAPPVDPSLPQQKLLFEAAGKAAEAGEPALSIQLYARLIARFPQSAFVEQARGAVQAQKQKLANP
jgi:hypothetical protein